MSAPTPEPAEHTAPAAPPMMPTEPEPSDSARASLEALRSEIAKAVVGQDPAVTGLVVALLCRGHVLLEGVPGVAKTLLVRALAASLELDTKRVQFTPDLMPSDVTGSLVYDARTAEFSFQPGPVFTNLLIADEINRTLPRPSRPTPRSDGGASGHRRRNAASTARTLPGRRDPEPRRVRRHLPPPRSPTGPLPTQTDGPAPLTAGRDRRPHSPRRRIQPPRPQGRRYTARRRTRRSGSSTPGRREDDRLPEIAGYVVDICRATRDSPSLALGVSPEAPPHCCRPPAPGPG